MSVSLADTFDREPEHISAKDATEVVRKFWEALVRGGEVLRERMRQRYMPEDYELLQKKTTSDYTRLLQPNTSSWFQLKCI